MRLLDLQPAIDRLCADWGLQLRSLLFTETEWVIMEELEPILEVSLGLSDVEHGKQHFFA